MSVDCTQSEAHQGDLQAGGADPTAATFDPSAEPEPSTFPTIDTMLKEMRELEPGLAGTDSTAVGEGGEGGGWFRHTSKHPTMYIHELCPGAKYEYIDSVDFPLNTFTCSLLVNGEFFIANAASKKIARLKAATDAMKLIGFEMSVFG
ncbi:hypothetical protein ACOMHN_061895 [Nucella lapillus]